MDNIWEKLDQSQRHMIVVAALVPPPISLDLWSQVASIPPIPILQLAEEFVQLKIMSNYEPLGPGHYYFNEPDTVEKILDRFGLKNTSEIARNLVNYWQKYEEGPNRWMPLAYLSQVTRLLPSEPNVLIKAAKYCLEKNLPDDASGYYQLLIDLTPSPITTLDSQKAFVDAVIGLCTTKGKTLPLGDQNKLLIDAEAYSKSIGDRQRAALIMAFCGQVNKRLGYYNKAAEKFESAWDLAFSSGSKETEKRVALAYTDFLIWQGNLSEAIKRYENVLGISEELPNDELSLVGCAQLGWAYGKNGQTIRGIGLIKSITQKAEELKMERLRVYSIVMTIVTLLDARRNAEVEPLIEQIYNIPHENLDRWILWTIFGARAYILSIRGDYEEAFKMLEQKYYTAKTLDNFHFRGPVNFDSFDILENEGFVHPVMNYETQLKRVIGWPDVYMQGVGYYYRAKRIIKKNGSIEESIKDLNKSIELLTQSGAKLDCSYSELLLGQLLLESNGIDQAEPLLKSAWSVLRLVNESLFPSEFRSIVQESGEDVFLLEPLIEINETLGTIRNKQELLKHVITLTIRLIGAERGAFFAKDQSSTEIIASRNIEPETFKKNNFQKTLESIENVLNNGVEIVEKLNTSKASVDSKNSNIGWRIIYPVKLQGKVLGGFFLERTLSGSEISSHIMSLLKVISTQVAVALDNVRAYEEIAELKDRLEAETLFYRNEPSRPNKIADIIGNSDKTKEVISQITDVAKSDTTVLIFGETGVGKELVAKAIHQLSSRSSGPFIPVNIASLNENTIASELFGHEKGAFTSALSTHRGRFELADEGTLFLDEVNSLSLDVQTKLLRVLEGKSFERVGGSKLIKPNFRLIAATNQSLEEATQNGTFRHDLYYRLNVYPIAVPPLRDRKEDIPLLISFFVGQFNKKFGKNFKNVNKRSMEHLLAYTWPGNVRELKHSVERSVLSCKTKQLTFDSLKVDASVGTAKKRFLPLKELEREHIIEALLQCRWKVSGKGGAAELLGINNQTLFTKIKRLKIKKSVGVHSG